MTWTTWMMIACSRRRRPREEPIAWVVVLTSGPGRLRPQLLFQRKRENYSIEMKELQYLVHKRSHLYVPSPNFSSIISMYYEINF